MDDLIRRSDAVKAVSEPYNEKFWDYVKRPISNVVNILKSISAVEPCKDAVSREWLLNELEEMNVANFYEANFHSNEMYGQMKRMIKAAPSVTVEPKQGEWSFIGDNMFECTHCGITYATKQFEVMRNYTTDPFAPEYCPKCGARMFAKGTNVPNKLPMSAKHEAE